MNTQNTNPSSESYFNIKGCLYGGGYSCESYLSSLGSTCFIVGYLGRNLIECAEKMIEQAAANGVKTVVIKSESREVNVSSGQRFVVPNSDLESLLQILNQGDSGIDFRLVPNPSPPWNDLLT